MEETKPVVTENYEFEINAEKKSKFTALFDFWQFQAFDAQNKMN